jgi:hypothetical protein
MEVGSFPDTLYFIILHPKFHLDLVLGGLTFPPVPSDPFPFPFLLGPRTEQGAVKQRHTVRLDLFSLIVKVVGSRNQEKNGLM